MGRVDIQEGTKIATTFGVVGYATIGDLIAGLENLKRERQKGGVDEISYEGLRRTIGRVLKHEVRLFGEIGEIDKLVWELGSWKADTPIETVAEEIIEEPEAVEGKLESKAVDPYLLKQLLRDYDEHQKMELEAERLAKKYKVPQEKVKEIIAEKLKAQAKIEEKIKIENPEEKPAIIKIRADEISDAEMVARAWEEKEIETKPLEKKAEKKLSNVRELLEDYKENEEELTEVKRLATKYKLAEEETRKLIQRKTELKLEAAEELKISIPNIDPELIEKKANEISETKVVNELRQKEKGAGEIVEAVLAESEEEKKAATKELTPKERNFVIEVAEETRARIAVREVASQRAEELTGRLEEAGVKIGPINEVAGVLENKLTEITEPETAERQIILMVNRNIGGWADEETRVEIRKTVKETEMPTKKEAVMKARQTEVEKEILPEFLVENETLTKEQYQLIKDYVAGYVELNEGKEVKIEASSVEAMNSGPREEGDEGEPLTRSQIETGLPRVETLVRIIRTAPEKFEKIVEVKNKLEEAGVKVPTIFKNVKFDTFNRVVETASKDPAAKKMLYFAQKREAIEKFVAGTTIRVVVIKKLLDLGAHKVIGNLALKIGLEKIAGKTVEVFARQTLRAMQRYGVEKGLGLAIKVTATKAAAKMAAGTVGKKLLTAVIAAVGGATGPPGWAITLLIMAADLAIQAVKWVGKKIGAFLGKIAQGLGIDTPELDRKLRETFGKLAPVVKFAGAAIIGLVGIVIGIPAMLAAVPLGIIGLVVGGAVVGPLALNHLQTGTQVSMLVPPPMGGGCVKIGSSSSSGEINCPLGVDPQTVDGVDKENYSKVAYQWKSGTNYSRECFDATVCMSRAAGVNPIWALWAWLHESGSSNYSSGPVEDFGVHYIGKTNDFMAQIEEFLKLEPGAGKCNTGDYWLDLATDYLTGQCDPDLPISTGMTGRMYLEEIKNTWGWIAPGVPLPSSIKISPSGETCEGDTSLARGGTTIVDENGDTWLCADEQTAAGMVNVEIPPWTPLGAIPEGCPNGLPVSGGYFTQGPFAPNCSHEHMVSPAIDIGIGDGAGIRATHAGIVKFGHDAIYGFYVDVLGKCQGKEFFTRYAHMPNWPNMANGAMVNAGDPIGSVDNTGSSTGSHIHYHINGLDKNYFGQYLGLNEATTTQLWGCCGVEWNGKACP